MNNSNKTIIFIFAIFNLINSFCVLQSYENIIILPYTIHEHEPKVLLIRPIKENKQKGIMQLGNYGLCAGPNMRTLDKKTNIESILFDKTRGVYSNLNSRNAYGITIRNCQALKSKNDILLFFVEVPYVESEVFKNSQAMNQVQEEVQDYLWVNIRDLIQLGYNIIHENPHVRAILTDSRNKEYPIFEGLWKLLKYHPEFIDNLKDILSTGKPQHFIEIFSPENNNILTRHYDFDYFLDNFTNIVKGLFSPRKIDYLRFSYFIYTNNNRVLLTIDQSYLNTNWNLPSQTYNFRENMTRRTLEQEILDHFYAATNSQMGIEAGMFKSVIIMPQIHTVLLICKKLTDGYDTDNHRWVDYNNMKNANFFTTDSNGFKLRLFPLFVHNILHNEYSRRLLDPLFTYDPLALALRRLWDHRNGYRLF